MSRHLDLRMRDECRRDQRCVAKALWRVLAPEATAGHGWLTEIGKRVERLAPDGNGFDIVPARCSTHGRRRSRRRWWSSRSA